MHDTGRSDDRQIVAVRPLCLFLCSIDAGYATEDDAVGRGIAAQPVVSMNASRHLACRIEVRNGLAPDVERLGVCIDLGHLWVSGENVETHLKRHLPHTRVIHLHGVRDGRDHLALTALPPGRLRPILNSIDKFTGVLTLEIFNYEEVRDSVVCLNQWNCSHK